MESAVRTSGMMAVMLGVRDLPKAAAFYTQKLGLEVLMQESEIALLQSGTAILGLNRGLARSAEHLNGATEVVFRVASVRGAHRALTAAGITFVSEPHPVTPADWVAHFRDEDGHLLSVFGPEGQS
jgi:catechol 2,3-dioxygenase-like lactoylglutathione lyase family enzyme